MCRTFYDGARQLRGVSLCLDTQREFALPARDYSVVARVSGWYDRLQQSRLAATGCPACALGWTPQAQGTCIYKLEARVARLYAARPALRGFRTSEGLSASVARSPPIGMIFPARGGLFWPSSFLRRYFFLVLTGTLWRTGRSRTCSEICLLTLCRILWKDILWVKSALTARGSALT